ncbi:glycoside hydrolase family 26 protein [Kitasatospora purpeofusca]|uniref:glycoside hydrolase family 26 protein n=1 Tax=Kitasatospora purpeofusca TaxID=67352 RepID=UPI002A5A76C0|nr:glycosyl hydrolase [Kitasatospora purpeofusca]MDY0814226.1 glycosyl hydrolase [Kitasatospora purpeofusca]
MRFGRLALAAATLLLLTTAGVPAGTPLSQTKRHALSSDGISPRGAAPRPVVQRPPHEPPFGAFVGSWDKYIPQIGRYSQWLGDANLQVGHTYLAGNGWADVEGEPAVLGMWSQWRLADPSRMLILGVPMLVPNEAEVPDGEVARLLAQGARGDFDRHFLRLARRLVALGGADTVLTLGWEMNGVTYTHRCKPDPAAWKTYWRRIVTVMRSVPGQRFRFDFTPNRGLDAIPWTKCYPGDDVVDILGMDSYDQPAGGTFDDYVREPYGLQDQVEFAAKRGKQVSYPEWGLFRNGDNPEFVQRMVEWIRTHDTAYQTVTDYCPHGFWQCDRNPRAGARFKQLMTGSKGAPAAPTAPPAPVAPVAPSVPAQPTPPGAPTAPASPAATPTAPPSLGGPGEPSPSAAPTAPASPSAPVAPTAPVSPSAAPSPAPTARPGWHWWPWW